MMIISKQYAHLQIIALTPVQLKRNRHKTLGGFTYTRNLVSIHFCCKIDLVHLVKEWQNHNQSIISKQYAYFKTMAYRHVEFQKIQRKSVEGLVHTR